MSIDSENIKQDLKRGVDYIGVTCVFFCHDGRGRVLLQKRSANCRDEQGTWDCGAGSMEFGEEWADAVRREVREEYCVEPLEIKLAEVRNVLRDNQGTPTHWIAVVHAVRIDPEQVKIGEPEKIDQIGWFAPEEFPDNKHSMLDKHFAVVKDHL